MNKNILSAIIVAAGILVSGSVAGLAAAQTAASPSVQTQPQGQQAPTNIQFPIKELGNCQSKSDCKVYCDNPQNSDACLAFASQNNLMTSEEISAAKKFQDIGMVGPGGCKGQAACDQYCENSDHLEECINFAQKNGLMSAQKQEDSRKVLAAIKSGLKPPACSGPQQCDAYCSSPDHMQECMAFSLAAGIVPDSQKAQMQKTLDAIKQGIKPPACRPTPPPGQPARSVQSGQGLEACDTYCSNPSHIEECMTFSLAAGMVPDSQKAQMQKTLDAIKRGIKPPSCRPTPPPGQAAQPGQEGLQACDQYCADPGHVEECAKFSVAIGNMSEQQAQTAIKTGGKGPGGCVGKDACDAFCKNPDNQETCFNFAKDNGMIPQDQLQQMQAGQQKMKDSFAQIPQPVLDCLTSSVGADVVEKMKNGTMIPQKFGEAISLCFQKFQPQGPGPDQKQPGPGQQGQEQPPMPGRPEQNRLMMPGQPDQPGQRNPQNQQRGDFPAAPGMMNPDSRQAPPQLGPGGCRGPEECRNYCESHPDACGNFQPSQNDPNRSGQQVPPPPQTRLNQNQPVPMQAGQPGQPAQTNQLNQLNQPNRTDPSGQPGQVQPMNPSAPYGQPGQMPPQQMQPPVPTQSQMQLPMPPQSPSPVSPTSFLIQARNLLGSVLDIFKR